MPEGDGNRLDESQLAVIGEHPKARALRISRLDQATFERLVTGYGTQFSAIEFEKCPRIADLSPGRGTSRWRRWRDRRKPRGLLEVSKRGSPLAQIANGLDGPFGVAISLKRRQ